MDTSKLFFRDTSQRKAFILKNDDFVEIFIPSVGLFSRFTLISLVFLTFPAYLINFFVLSLPSFGHKFLIPVFVFNSLISLVAVLVILLSEFAQKRLSITRQKISWVYEIFGLRIRNLRPADTQGIIRITKTQHSWNRRFLEIWAGRRLYELSTGEFSLFAVTNPEIDLIAKELSNWLDLTILQDELT
jgi:uncharacterized membrane protein